MNVEEVAFHQDHDWDWSIPFGMSADGVVVAYCKECNIQIVFNLDIDSAVVIGGE
tara:strand:- start:471 stop:635 length:165 start_codon:yes stop_codon:yes gene_type:complete